MDHTSGDEAPLHVPDEFEAAHLDEARRTVRRSHAWWRRPGPWVDGPGDPQGQISPFHLWRRIVAGLHALAALLTMALAVVTGTWLAGTVVLIGVAIFLAASLWILRLWAQRLPP